MNRKKAHKVKLHQPISGCWIEATGKRPWSEKRRHRIVAGLSDKFIKDASPKEYLEAFRRCMIGVYEQEVVWYSKYLREKIDLAAWQSAEIVEAAIQKNHNTEFFHKDLEKNVNLWLTKGKKKDLLEWFEKSYKNGDIDPGVADFVRAVNKYDFICTHWSCEGHPNGERSGYLVLAVYKKYFSAINQMVSDLLEKEYIYQAHVDRYVYGDECCHNGYRIAIYWDIKYFDKVKTFILRRLKKISEYE